MCKERISLSLSLSWHRLKNALSSRRPLGNGFLQKWRILSPSPLIVTQIYTQEEDRNSGLETTVTIQDTERITFYKLHVSIIFSPFIGKKETAMGYLQKKTVQRQILHSQNNIMAY